ncbi:MAG: hypothetical protein JWQ97_998 [Phenylobacterium sp.]|nr:hypothetical protein [Phenylobacterium sp.]
MTGSPASLRAATIDAPTFARIRSALDAAGFAEDVTWSEELQPPASAEDFALEAIFVICNSGMKNTVARGIYERVRSEMEDGGRAFEAFKHPGKAAAIDAIWDRRFVLYETFMAQTSDDLRLSFCESLPWIGGITKFHLAKNFGVDVAKPDVHLQRLADREGVTAQALCERLACATGLRAATVDVVLWRACAEGIINSRTGEVRAP